MSKEVAVPFSINIPNALTEETLKKTRKNEEVSSYYDNLEEMFKDLKSKNASFGGQIGLQTEIQ